MSEKKRVREVEMLGALAAGVALGGVVSFTLLSYFWEWGVLKGARWWDVMTAFGTVGAVAFSLTAAMWLRVQQKQRQKRSAALRVAGLGPEVAELMWVVWDDSLRRSEPTDDAFFRIAHLQKDILKTIHPKNDEFDPALNEFLFLAYEALERARVHARQSFNSEIGLGFALLRNAWEVTKAARRAVGHKWIDRKLDLRKRS